MLIVFECTTVFQVRRRPPLEPAREQKLTPDPTSRSLQRLRTVNEFRSMSIKPYAIMTRREGKWVEVQTDELLPGDVVSIGAFPLSLSHTHT